MIVYDLVTEDRQELEPDSIQIFLWDIFQNEQPNNISLRDVLLVETEEMNFPDNRRTSDQLRLIRPLNAEHENMCLSIPAVEGEMKRRKISIKEALAMLRSQRNFWVHDKK